MALNEILGAMLSTAGGVIVGVFLFWWRTRAEEKEELRKWFAKTERLAERVINSSGPIGHSEKQESAAYVRNTCAGVHTNLANHLSEAPVYVNQDVIIECENLVELCQIVKDSYHPRPGPDKPAGKTLSKLYESLDDAIEQAEIVQSQAEAAREKVS